MLRTSCLFFTASIPKVTVRFATPAVKKTVPTALFASTFNGNVGQVAWTSSSLTSSSRSSVGKRNHNIDLYVGLGKKPDSFTLLKAVHAAIQKARSLSRYSIVIQSPSHRIKFASNADVSLTQDLLGTSTGNKHKFLTQSAVAEKLSCYAYSSAYDWDLYKKPNNADTSSSSSSKKKKKTSSASENNKMKISFTEQKKFQKEIKVGEIIANNINLARDWGNLRPDVGTPDYFAKQAKLLTMSASSSSSKKKKSGSFYSSAISPAKLSGVRCVEHLRGKQLEQKGLRLFYAVGKGSPDVPNMVVLEYIGDPKSSSATGLVGKGIVMDTGGLNVKPYGSMETMHLDMQGGSAVFGAFRAAAMLKLKTNIVCSLNLANNACGSASYQPSEILRSLKGSTVEIKNTDAEGRLVLADALTFIQHSKKIKKNVTQIIDVATLTGAICVALGNERAGCFFNSGKLCRELIAAGDKVNEPLWAMPVGPEHHKAMKGAFSTLSNCATGRYGGSCSAAAFLQHFIDKKDKKTGKLVRWSHLDIAGPAMGGERLTATHPAGATGFAVALLTQFLRSTASSK